MAKYRITFSDKVHIREEVEANSLEEAKKKAEEFLNCVVEEEDGTKTRCYEMNEWEADLLPAEKYYFEIENIERLD